MMMGDNEVEDGPMFAAAVCAPLCVCVRTRVCVCVCGIGASPLPGRAHSSGHVSSVQTPSSWSGRTPCVHTSLCLLDLPRFVLYVYIKNNYFT